MQMPSIDAVLRGIVAEQAQIKKIRSQRQEFEGGKISFVKRGRIGPRPANTIFFQKVASPAALILGMTKERAFPTAKRKKGNTISVGVRPCQAACSSGG